MQRQLLARQPRFPMFAESGLWKNQGSCREGQLTSLGCELTQPARSGCPAASPKAALRRRYRPNGAAGSGHRDPRQVLL